MAVVFDAKSTGSSDPESSTLTWSHTCTGDNRLLVVTVGESRNVTVTGVTYNGVALTKAKELDGGGGGNDYASIWYLIAPDTGTNDIVVTYSGSITVPRAGGASFTNALQTAVLGATNSVGGTAQNKSLALTTTEDGSVIIECIGALGGIHTPTAGQTVINTDGNNRIGGYEIVGAAQEYTQTWDSTSSNIYSMVNAEFKGLASAETPSLSNLSLLGVS